MKTTLTTTSWTRSLGLSTLLAGSALVLNMTLAQAGCAIAVDQHRGIEASSYGNRKESVLISEARAKVARKGGKATGWVSTSRKGYGAVAQKGSNFGYGMACSSQAEADRMALSYAKGGRIIDRWRDR